MANSKSNKTLYIILALLLLALAALAFWYFYKKKKKTEEVVLVDDAGNVQAVVDGSAVDSNTVFVAPNPITNPVQPITGGGSAGMGNTAPIAGGGSGGPIFLKP